MWCGTTCFRTWQHLDAVARNVSYVASATMANGDIALATISNGDLSLRFGHRDGTWTAPTVIDHNIAAVTLGADTNGDLHVFPLALNGVVWHNVYKPDGTVQRLPEVARNASSVAAIALGNGDVYVTTISGGNVSQTVEHPDGTATSPTVIDSGGSVTQEALTLA